MSAHDGPLPEEEVATPSTRASVASLPTSGNRPFDGEGSPYAPLLLSLSLA